MCAINLKVVRVSIKILNRLSAYVLDITLIRTVTTYMILATRAEKWWKWWIKIYNDGKYQNKTV